MKNKRLEKLIADDIQYRIDLANGCRVRLTDSMSSLTPRERKIVRMLADNQIRIHDKKYNDIVGSSIFLSIFTSLILPAAINLVKNAVVSGVSNQVTQRIIEPTVGRLITAGQNLTRNKGADDTYVNTIERNIKEDLGTLTDTLKKEGSSLAGKFSGLYSKIKNVV